MEKLSKTLVHGFKTYYSNDIKTGIDYLRYDLDYSEAKVFFNQARIYGRANFEDDDDRQYVLIYNSDGSYTLKKRGY